MQTNISIHHLAVLRAATENAHLGTYFASFGALDAWTASCAGEDDR